MALIKYLNYKGEKLPYRVGYYALKMTQKDTGQDVMGLTQEQSEGDANNVNNFEMYEALLFYSLQQGYKMQDKEFTFKKEDMETVMDECFVEFFRGFPDFFRGLEEAKSKTVRKTPPQKK